MAQAASKTCEICMAAPGSQYCCECDQLFCDGCKTSHLRTKMTKNHTFLSGPNINPEEKILCQEHSENLIFDCEQCCTPACQTCVITTHKGHKMTGIKDSIATVRSEITEAIRSKLEILKSDAANIDQGINSYNGGVEKAINAIKKEGQAVKEMVDRKVEALVKTLKEKQSSNLSILSECQQSIQYALDQVKKHKKNLVDIKKSVGEAAVLQKLKRLKEDVEKMEPVQMPNVPTVNYTTNPLTANDIDNLFGNLSFQELTAEVNAREDAQNRFSEMMRKQLKHNNPAITDFGDPYRPLKLVEKFLELYDNEGTDTIEEIAKITRDETIASKVLLTVVTDTYRGCYDLRHKGEFIIGCQNKSARVFHQVKDMSDDNNVLIKKMTTDELQPLKQLILDSLSKEVSRQVLTCLTSSKKQYLTKCLEICWPMVCHSPPIHLEWNYSGKQFDSLFLRPFTEAGDVVDFVVWPVTFLHKNGPLVCKGVAQGRSRSHQTNF